MTDRGITSGAGLLAFATGIALIPFLPALPDGRYLAAGVVLAVILLRCSRAAPAGCMMLGMVWHCYCGQLMLATEIPAAWEERVLLVEGRVRGLVHRTPMLAAGVHSRFEFEVSRVSHEGRPLTVRRPLALRLNWYWPAAVAADQPGQRMASAGLVTTNQRWQFAVLLQRPRGLANPGTFDYRRWLLARGLGGTGKVVAGADNRLLGDDAGRLTALRGWYQQRLQQHLQGREVAPLLTALAIGERQQLTASQRQVLAATGTAHLMVISGLHVGLSALFGFAVSYLLFAVIPSWVQCGRALWWARCAAFAMATLYAGMAGFALPTQRALIMLLVFLVARQSGREVAGLRGWLLALVLVLLLDPLAVAAAGFWLSFAAVLLLMVPAARALTRSRWRLTALPRQWRLSLGLCPLIALWGGQLSLIAPLVNLIAIPFVGFLVVPPLLLALLVLPVSAALGGLLLDLAAATMECCWQGLTWAASIGGELTSVAMYPAPAAQLFALLAVLVFLLPRGAVGRGAWPLLLLPLFVPARPDSGALELYVLDVGQGTAVVVRVSDKVLVYDTGPAYQSGFNAGDAVLLPFLRRMGVARVDRLIVSHGDTDHSGGAHALLNAVTVSSWMAPASIAALDPPDILCRAGQRWQWGEVRFAILHPTEPVASRSNNRSCVLLIEAPEARYLLAGDIERSAEHSLTKRLGPGLAADVLLVPHHGSASSSSWDFSWFVRPTWAVISSGHRNRFAHPHQRVVRRYEELGAEVINTAETGAVRFSAADSYAPYRWFYTRYWRNYPCSMSASASASWWLGRVWWPNDCNEPPQAVRSAFL